MNIYTLIYYFRHLQHWWFRYNLKILTISASLQPANEVVEGNVFSCVWLFISHDAIGQSQVTWDLSTHSHSLALFAHMGLPQPQLPTDMIKLVPFGSTPWTSWKVAFAWKVFMFWMGKQDWENIYHRKNIYMWLPKGILIWCKEFDAANFTHHPRRCRFIIVF